MTFSNCCSLGETMLGLEFRIQEALTCQQLVSQAVVKTCSKKLIWENWGDGAGEERGGGGGGER